jgi:hypothetical protein
MRELLKNVCQTSQIIGWVEDQKEKFLKGSEEKMPQNFEVQTGMQKKTTRNGSTFRIRKSQ